MSLGSQQVTEDCVCAQTWTLKAVAEEMVPADASQEETCQALPAETEG